MDKIKKSCLFRTISLVLILTFISLDISCAYPPEHNASNSTLATPSVLQQQPVNLRIAQSVFSQGELLGAISSIGKYILDDKLPLKHLDQVISAELGKAIEGIDLSRVTVKDGVVSIPCVIEGKRRIVQIALKDSLAAKDLTGKDLFPSDKYVIRELPGDRSASGTKSFPASPVSSSSLQLFLSYGSALNKVVLTVPDKLDDNALRNLLLDITNAIYTFGASTVSIYSKDSALLKKIQNAFSIGYNDTYDGLVNDSRLKADPYRAFKITNAYLKELYGSFEVKAVNSSEKQGLEANLKVSKEAVSGTQKDINIEEAVNDLARKSEYYLGLDIGASGIKVGVQTVKLETKTENNEYKISPEGIYSRRFVWSASKFSTSKEHHDFILETIKKTLTDLGLRKEHIKGIGVSIPAGVWGERIAPATFNKGIENPKDRQNLLIDLSDKINKEYGFRPVFNNDGSIAAFYVSVIESKKDVLCASLGSGLGTDYVDKNGRLTGSLTEMGKLSIYRESTTRDHSETGIKGAATQYVSQKGVFYLAEYGTDADNNQYLTDEERKVFKAITEDAQKSFFLRILMENASFVEQDNVRVKIEIPKDMKSDDADYGATKVRVDEAKAIYENILIGLNDQAVIASTKVRVKKIFEVVGEDVAKVIISAYPLLKMRSVIVFGGVASKGRGDIIIKKAKEVLDREFPEISKKVEISLSGDSEFTQSIGAAYYAYQQSLQKITQPQVDVGTKSFPAGEDELNSNDRNTRMELEVRQHLEHMRSMYEDDAESVRGSAQALLKMGKETVPVLMEALGDAEGEIRSAAAAALGNLGPEAGEAIPYLIKMLKEDSYTDARVHAARALGRIGPDSSQVLYELTAVLGACDVFSNVGVEIKRTLKRIADEQPASGEKSYPARGGDK
jgi:hypothetical protein